MENCPDPVAMEVMDNGVGGILYQSDGAIDPAGDIDFLSFPAEAGMWYLIGTAQDLTIPTDTVVTVFSPAGQQVARNDDGVALGSRDSELFYRAIQTGNHCLRVEDQSTANGGPPEGGSDYLYRAIALPIDFDLYDLFNVDSGSNDSTSSPQTALSYEVDPITFQHSAQIAGDYASSSDVDVYELIAPESAQGMQVYFTPNGVDGYGGTTTQGVVDIYAADGITVVGRMDYLNNQRGLSLPTAQYALAIPEGAEGPGAGTCNLGGFDQTTQQIYTPADLNGLATGDVITGLALRLSGDSLGSSMSRFDVALSTGPETLSTTFANNFLGTPVTVRSGPIVFDDVADLCGPGCLIPFSKTIAFDTPYTYQGANLLVEVRHTQASSELECDRLESPADPNQGQSVGAADDDATIASFGPVPENWAMRLEVMPVTPTYYLHVDSAQAALGSNPFYYLKWQTSDGWNPQETDDAANDDFGGAETATPIDTGFGISHFIGGTLPGDSDIDWWSFEAESGDTIVLACASSRNGSGVQDLTARMYSNPAGSPLQQDIESITVDLLWSSAPGATRPPVTASSTGVHYLSISAGLFSSEVTDRHYICGIHVS